jgi:hypothetical protein
MDLLPFDFSGSVYGIIDNRGMAWGFAEGRLKPTTGPVRQLLLKRRGA